MWGVFAGILAWKIFENEVKAMVDEDKHIKVKNNKPAPSNRDPINTDKGIDNYASQLFERYKS